MDKSKEEMKPEEKPHKPILTPLITTTNILTSTDDDASTESSDTFETWTLVSDKQKEHKLDVGEDRIENFKKENDENDREENVQEQQLQDSLNDVTNDDFSDGISIISESESVGRISPHPYLRDHLQDLNMKFSLNDNIDDVIINRLRQETPIVLQRDPEEQQLRQRRRSSTSPPPTDCKDEQALQKASQTIALASEFPPFIKRGLQGIFYVGVGLAILALIGKIVNPTWQPLASVSPSASTLELEQKVNDMELQNNLMRAEIDLLNKQVKYLNTLNDPQQKGKYKDYKEGKTFKAWSGNGDSLKPVDITKEDLKRPYKCPDGTYVEIANMCMEQRPAHNPSIVDQFGQVVEDLKEQSEAFKTFEKVAEELQGFQDNPYEQLQSILGDETPATAPTQKQKMDYIKNKPIYETSEDFKQQLPRPNFEDNQQQQFSTHKHYENDKPKRKYDESSKPSKEYKNKFEKEFKPENKEFKKQYDNKPSQEKFEKFRDISKERNQWKNENVDKFKDDSKFRDNSKERKGRKFNNSEESKENNSKERFNRQQKRKFDKDNDDSGEWQEKYMKHRENQRKENEQKYQENKNWYIKRGDSREYKRSGEKQFR